MSHSPDRVRLPAGTTVFSVGDSGDFAYVIESGQVEIFLPRDGDAITLAIRGPGELIGEMAVIDGGVRSATVRTLTDCEFLLITAAQVAHRLAATDPILRMCLGVVIDRFRNTVQLLKEAETAPSGSRIPTPSPMGDEFRSVVKALTVERELKNAILNGELALHLQPIVRLGNRRLAGFEALMRWNHPTRGMVSPADFIPIAEASGLIIQMTRWCVEEVSRLLPPMMAAGLRNVGAVEPLFMSINVSGHDLMQPAFAQTVGRIMEQAGIVATSVKLEVTESVLMNDPKGAARVLAECRERGMGIAIDDFGTGYSSLSYLSTLPITTLKVDRSFVAAMVEDPTSRKIVNTILRLAYELEIPVVAEGIETLEQESALAAMGCGFGQGYLFGRPATFDTTLDVIRGWEGIAPSAPPALASSR